MKIISEEAEKLDIEIHQSSEINPVKNIQLNVKNTSFEINGQQLTVPLTGHHQSVNAQTAMTVCQVFESGLKKGAGQDVVHPTNADLDQDFVLF